MVCYIHSRNHSSKEGLLHTFEKPFKQEWFVTYIRETNQAKEGLLHTFEKPLKQEWFVTYIRETIQARKVCYIHSRNH
ncbi:hypothetical protein LOTGIDRAFT_105522 [Lottia gigantea]|uniref:Uncharacterized protein n=1 Tax=Lottia gigantea TaxID=225164 RepID=V4A828_LOTGI|nr:hypothetical protein LOTGIDRAFT_105522 [Lottia gigantea]ESO91205.1 hypothetical protein LOTGIDRAFT_105522 [Lottia gigantea]